MNKAAPYRKNLLSLLLLTDAIKTRCEKALSDFGGLFFLVIDYDRLGRLIVKQDTKQRNYKRLAYTYSLYDQLNRITEVGQKTENTDVTTFNTIFGDTVLTTVPNPSIVSPSKFLAWIKDNSGPRTEVTHTYYDVQDILPTRVLIQNELRNRPASITYADTLRVDSTIFKNASYYSYDVHGNVQTLIQDDSVYNVGAGQRYKRIDYQFDLVSGNVNEVDYQNDSLDQYHHRYVYDLDNRISQLQTSKDSVNWDNDANYFYYAHNKLARVEFGDQQVQGMDYAYTLQGWMKGVNSDALSANKDMGEDGLKSSGNLNSGFARDAMGYTLKYFDKSTQFPGDYDAIDTARWNHIPKRFEAKTYGSDLTNTRRDLFNGNPTAMATNIQQPQAYSEGTPTLTATTLPQGTSYGYDQLNRLVEMKAFQNLDTATNVWGTTGTYNGLYHNWLSYDANGNILTQKRADSLGEVFDSLTYHYNIANGLTIQNRLYHVNDVADVSTIHDDIKDEGTFSSTSATINQRNNYRYNAIGQLAKDSAAGLDTIIWTTYGKEWKIKKYNGDSLIFGYNCKQDKILKEYKPASGNPVSTYYVHDPQGRIFATYTKQGVGMSMSFTLTERDIYGTKRIGAEKTPVQLIGTLGGASKVDTFKRYLGFKEYELDNHLDNVVALISDRKIPRPNIAQDSINHFEADVVSSQDYYPFGQLEPGRMFSSAKYRWSFNGKEKVDEITGFTGTDYDYGMRMYDARLGRFMSIDPLTRKYPSLTPYQFASNSPIRATDLDGLEQNVKSTPPPASVPTIQKFDLRYAAAQIKATQYLIDQVYAAVDIDEKSKKAYEPELRQIITRIVLDLPMNSGTNGKKEENKPIKDVLDFGKDLIKDRAQELGLDKAVAKGLISEASKDIIKGLIGKVSFITTFLTPTETTDILTLDQVKKQAIPGFLNQKVLIAFDKVLNGVKTSKNPYKLSEPPIVKPSEQDVTTTTTPVKH